MENSDNIDTTQMNTAKDMKLLFCIPNNKTAESCCCGCTLRLGTQIITILGLIGVIVSLYDLFNPATSGNHKLFGDFYYYSDLILVLLLLVSYSLIIYSTFYNRFDRAYLGLILYQAGFIISTVVIVVLPFIIIGENASAIYAVYFLTLIPSYITQIYFLYILFSFVKELGLGNIAKLDGLQVNVAANNQNNFQQGGVYIPLNDFNQRNPQQNSNQVTPRV